MANHVKFTRRSGAIFGHARSARINSYADIGRLVFRGWKGRFLQELREK